MNRSTKHGDARPVDLLGRAARAGAFMTACFVVLASMHTAFSVAAAQDAQSCGSLENAFGPFDYTDPENFRLKRLDLVESAHFTPEVESLVRGASSVNPLDDIDYTLRAFPNHHRALNAVANYHLQNGLQQHGRYTVECWFERAMRFKPADGNVRLVYGIFLAKKGSKEAALEQYEDALDLMPESAEAHYNIALLYMESRQYELANQHAVKAYSLGFPLPWLQNRLQELQVWNPDAGP